MQTIAKQIQKQLIKQTDAKKSKWWENYVKHDIKSRGVPMQKIKEIVQKEYGTDYNQSSPIQNERLITDDLMSQDYMEDKLAAILIMENYWIKNENYKVKEQLQIIENWMDQKYIYDWNICDWLGIKVMHTLTNNIEEQKNTLNTLKKWNKDPYLWKARISLVSFCMRKDQEPFEDLIFEFSQELIKREERFCKTAVGWAMRDFSNIDKQKVIKFLEENEEFTTKEVVNNATKHHKKLQKQNRKTKQGNNEDESEDNSDNQESELSDLEEEQNPKKNIKKNQPKKSKTQQKIDRKKKSVVNTKNDNDDYTDREESEVQKEQKPKKSLKNNKKSIKLEDEIDKKEQILKNLKKDNNSNKQVINGKNKKKKKNL